MSNLFVTRPSSMPKFVPRSYKSLSDTGIDTAEALDNSETDVDCDADATSAIPAGTVIRIDNEFMLVTATGTTLTVTRAYASSTAATHLTNADIYKKVSNACVLWLPGQDDAYSATIRDRSGYGNNGTITGATWTRLPTGLHVLDYDGTDDVTIITDADNLDITSQVTILAWIYADTLDSSESHHVITKRSMVDDATNYGINFEAGSGNKNKLQFYLYDGGFRGFQADSATTTGVWHQVGATFDNTTKACQLIQDGAVVKSDTFNYAMAANIANVSIGALTSGVERFDGKMALHRILTRIPSTDEIAKIFQQERSLLGV